MIDFLKSLYKPDIKPLNYIKIYKENILHNFEVLQSYQSQFEIWPVLKSNAYGHGLKEVSKILKSTKGKYICVDSFPEYQIVKKYSGKKVLVLGETRSENYKFYDFSSTTFCIYNLETLEYLIGLNKKITIHLFINTGMNREGFQQENLEIALQRLKKSKIIVEGVCSHFSSADEVNHETSDKQIEEFKAMYEIILSYDYNPKYKHIAASAGSFKLEDNFFNAYRPGVALFGVNVFDKQDIYYPAAEKLKLCMELYSTVIKVQNVAASEGISYNRTYYTQSQTQIASISFGYFEGFDRRLSNNYQIELHEKLYPIRGRICMNISMFEVEKKQVHVGDEVRLMGIDRSKNNTVYDMAESCDTIPYEILVKINQNIRRQVV